MNLEIIFKLLTLLQFIAASQNSHVQEAKHHIRAEVRSALGTHRYYGSPPSHAHKRINHHHHHHHPNRNHNHHHQRQGPHVHRLHTHPHPHRWSSGRQGRHAVEHHHFTAWTAWSVCSDSGNGHGNGNGHSSGCIKRRERFCKVKRKCGHTKHVEERKCWGCTQPEPVWHLGAHYEPPPPPQQPVILHQPSDTPHSIIINAAAAAVGGGQQQPVTVVTATATSTDAPPTAHGHQIRMPVLEEIVVEPGSHGHSQSHHHYPHVITAAGDEYPGLSEPEEEESGERDDAGAEDDFFVINARSKFRRQPRPIFIDSTDYSDLAAEDHDGLSGAVWPASRKRAVPVQAMRMRNHRSKLQQRRAHGRALRQGSSSSSSSDDGVEGDVFQYEDFDFDPEVLGRGGAAGTGSGVGVGVGVGTGGGAGVNGASYENQYSESYEDLDYGNTSWATQVAPSKEKATPDALIPRHRRIYSKWSRWTKCSPKCTTRRYKKCRVKEQCGREVLREIAYCYTEGSFCQQWLQAQMQKSPAYELRPVTAAKRRDISFGTQSNAIVGDYIMNGKGYRGPEYTPMKLKCGIAGIRSNKRNMYNMLKIIGGKAARKGEWPWQVAIINRFKEAFCGGTLIAPQWVLTAAHCVRKVLYVRIGEHNLDYGDGTEFQMRVLKSFKHPSFDKKTVDSDVALLKLPKPVNATTWVGFSCLPRPYQPLPKNVDCTVIGWGKRRNRDVAGTSVLHQAEVPIIPMDNCRSVYHDYTITKNMFCAGHKRGRIDTCAGDSGGPLLCRDSTKPNHPWTIFGITSFGDGCAKRNKFGIYAKVPNYVDWVWSVINCNGNCKLYQRGYSD